MFSHCADVIVSHGHKKLFRNGGREGLVKLPGERKVTFLWSYSQNRRILNPYRVPVSYTYKSSSCHSPSKLATYVDSYWTTVSVTTHCMTLTGFLVVCYLVHAAFPIWATFLIWLLVTNYKDIRCQQVDLTDKCTKPYTSYKWAIYGKGAWMTSTTIANLSNYLTHNEVFILA